MKYSFIHVEKANHRVRVLCDVLGVSHSGYYDWIGRGPSRRDKANMALSVRIKAIHEASRGTYGSPRVEAELREDGIRAGHNRIARLMHQMGLVAAARRRWRRTTDSGHELPIAPNVVQRDFHAERPNQLWATDITYVWTWQGWLYLAVIVDLFSRRVVGWAAAEHMRTELVPEALQMALQRRVPGEDLVHHSDRGSQYASNQYRVRLKRHGITCSMFEQLFHDHLPRRGKAREELLVALSLAPRGTHGRCCVTTKVWTCPPRARSCAAPSRHCSPERPTTRRPHPMQRRRQGPCVVPRRAC